MGNEPGQVRQLALSRHYDTALEKGALLVAIARCSLTDREPLYQLRQRHHVQLIELLHDFCYHARKAIELAEEYEPGTVAHATRISLPGFEERSADMGMEGSVPLAQESLWWVLGRVIHSREVSVREREEVEVDSEWAAAPRTTSYWSPVIFAVRSDRDDADERHHVQAERVVEAFLALTQRFEKALAAAHEPPA